MRSKSDMIPDNELLDMFKEQDTESTRAGRGDGKAEGLHHLHQHHHDQNQTHHQSHQWTDINGYNLQNSTSFCEFKSAEIYDIPQLSISASNPYLGGPNITPPFSRTGELVEAGRRQQDSESSSESESSQGSHHRAESQGRPGGVRLNKDEKLARENGITLSIKVVSLW